MGQDLDVSVGINFFFHKPEHRLGADLVAQTTLHVYEQVPLELVGRRGIGPFFQIFGNQRQNKLHIRKAGVVNDIGSKPLFAGKFIHTGHPVVIMRKIKNRHLVAD